MNFVELDKIFDPFLLCDIQIFENDKLIKEGKLKMVQVKNNILKIYYEYNKSIKSIEYYYPFELQVFNNKIIFDYNIKKLYKNNIILKTYIESFKDTTSLLLNKQIKIIKK